MTAALHWEINGEKDSILWQDLQKSLSWLSRLPRAFSIISNSSVESLGNRAIDNPENREWWRTEFDLGLPIK